MSCPVTPEHLRNDWPERSDLTPQQRDLLNVLPDERLNKALEEAFTSSPAHPNAWYGILDSVRDAATAILVADLPDPKAARKGTKDECSECGLPITAQKGGAWIDDIMGSDACPKGREHNPVEVGRKFREALQHVAQAGATAAAAKGVQVVVALDEFWGPSHGEEVAHLLIELPPGTSPADLRGDLEAVFDGWHQGKESAWNSESVYPRATIRQSGLNQDLHQVIEQLATLGWKATEIHQIAMTPV